MHEPRPPARTAPPRTAREQIRAVLVRCAPLWVRLRPILAWCVPSPAVITGLLLFLASAGLAGGLVHVIVSPRWGETRLSSREGPGGTVYRAEVWDLERTVTGRPGEQVRVRWAAENRGDAAWAADTVWAEPETEGLPILTLDLPLHVGERVNTGEHGAFEGWITLPEQPGRFRAVWVLKHPKGSVQGGRLEAEVVVLSP